MARDCGSPPAREAAKGCPYRRKHPQQSCRLPATSRNGPWPGPWDIGPATNNNVVVAALVVKKSVAIANINVAGNVPARADVVPLRIDCVQVTAPGRTLHGE